MEKEDEGETRIRFDFSKPFGCFEIAKLIERSNYDRTDVTII